MELNPISKHLHDFIQSYPNKYHFKFTSSSKIIMKHLLSDISQATLDWKTSDSQTIPYSVDLDSDLFSSIPSKIKQNIKEWRTNTQHSYRFSISDRIIQVYICIPHANVDISFFQDSLKLIYLWLSVAFKYATNECSQEMNIYLYLSDFPKNKNESGEPMEPYHANTAYTNLCSPSTNTIIFRQEEWFKVLIHETFHNLGLDFSTMDIKNIQQELAKYFNVDSKFELFETYNETWAEIMNIVFLGFLTKQSTPDIISEIENLLNLEIHFSLFQCVKVLQHHHLKYSDILLLHSPNSSGDRRSPTELSLRNVGGVNAPSEPPSVVQGCVLRTLTRPNSYREHTNIFCYYVLKSLLLFFTNDFMLWCQKHNVENLLNFTKTPKNLENFCKFVLKFCKKPEYLQEMNKMETWSEKQQQDDIVRNTMRMTIFG